MSASSRRRDFRSTLQSHDQVSAPAAPPSRHPGQPAVPGAAAAQQAVLGAAQGQTALQSAGGARPLSSAGSVLPVLAEAPKQARRWWRHPAFLVSVGLTFVAVAATATLLIVSAVTDDSVTVSGLSAEVAEGNLHLDWSGPDAEYSLYAVDGDGTATDLTQFVRGTEAWLYSAAAVYDDSTCFVVRPGGSDAAVALDAATLDAQRAQSVCTADAVS